MPRISLETQSDIIAHLVRGVTLRSTAQLTKVNRATITSVLQRVGHGCEHLHHLYFHSLPVLRLELDEVWTFVGKKQRRLLPTDPPEFGDQYVFVALDPRSKCVISYRIGKRNAATTEDFLRDLKGRLAVKPSLSSDSFISYVDAVHAVFGTDVHYGQIIKLFKGQTQESHGEDLVPSSVAAIRRTPIFGEPDLGRINTTFVERQNLTMRQEIKRMARRTAGWSKRLDNHKAAISLHFAHYNFCRIHQSIGTTPACFLGLTEQPWPIEYLAFMAQKVQELQAAE